MLTNLLHLVVHYSGMSEWESARLSASVCLFSIRAISVSVSAQQVNRQESVPPCCSQACNSAPLLISNLKIPKLWPVVLQILARTVCPESELIKTT